MLPLLKQWRPRSLRSICHNGTIATAVKPTEEKKPKRRSSKSTEFTEYLKKLQILKQSSDSPNHTWATDYIRVKRGAQASLYLAQEEVGEEIKTILQGQNLDPEATVIEFNPGFGVLTSYLKNELGFRYVNCFEDDSQLGDRLTEKFGVNVIPFNFISFPRLHHADKQDAAGRVGAMLSKINHGNSKLYIFGATGNSSLLNFSIRTLVTRRVLFEEDFPWDGISFYIALGSKPTIIFTSSPQSLYTLYRPASILFQLLFHHQVLGTLPRKAFLPWETREAAHELKDPSERYKRVRIQYDPETISLLHFRPNMEVIERVGKDKLIQLWYFIRHNLHSRKNPVISELEQWVPGCGPRLILQGFSIYTQFGSLTPPQILDLYCDFTSWPEYPSSSFCTAVEKFQSKVEASEDDVLDFPKPT